MRLSIAYNGVKNGIELRFSEEPIKELALLIRELGFKESLSNPKMWYVANHPAYNHFTKSLKEVLDKGDDWRTVEIQPSFSPSLENIDTDKFSVVTIYYKGEEKAETQDYVLFDSYKKVAAEIASRFAMETYGGDFKHLEVFPRNYKRKARSLFKEGKIISETPSLANSHKQTKLILNEEVSEPENEEKYTPKQEEKQKIEESKTPETTELKKPIVKEEEIETLKLRETLNEVIGELLTLEETLEGESETIIGTTLFDLEEAAEEQNDIHFKTLLLKSIQLFKDWVDDLDAPSRLIAIASMSKLTQLLDGTTILETKKKPKGKSIAKDIFSRDHIVKNVLVPAQAGEPFQSGGLYVNERDFLKIKFPELYKISDDNINKASGLELFQLSQMAHPKDFGIDVNRSTVLQEWESRGREAFKDIGFPTDLNYPYVNIHVGYKSVSPLGVEVQAHEDKHKWWAVVEHARPIADLAKGIAIIDEKLMEFVEQRLEVINSKTGKPKTDKKSKEIYSDISWQIERLEKSKQVILDYLNKDEVPEESKEQTKTKKKKTKKQKDYIDRVVAVMHIAYTESKRLSKKKIEILKEETGAPNLGMLWEAVELSWLLWYKMIYREPILFEDRLRKMEQFWNNVQPTYAYSDSSKELYKQYSTPCPIGAIIAEYTQMKTADFIFEPSAGNGLLVMGANPRITHVNEIDTNRKHSLEYQKFGRITTENAAEPFPETMHKVHDVVVTNPPFAKWEVSKFDKERISQKYFQNNLGVANNIRLEHLMSGFALYTMTDHGRAAIIIMGHIYFGADGLLAKYRPFFNWLYRHYIVDDVINMNSYKLYNRQGAVERTMLILIGGRKTQPGGVAPTQEQAPYLETIVETFSELWKRVKSHIKPTINTIIQQLKIAKT
ncbi:N-6 DNA methylase [Flavivirga rizhaonensis]|uniref:DNA methylase adenine-specific domain-containing protein n=1 Tax=Flavivirga rizhaonensis TaxID=2559571 RepID=A0A4S1E0Z5_9FLAO|nr:N-6 DNA methylase [Flavivirga rizhaonensis]TGV03588.1 hypothetical protein EM932_06055 [Flavivirga rizhaonensis]